MRDGWPRRCRETRPYNMSSTLQTRSHYNREAYSRRSRRYIFFYIHLHFAAAAAAACGGMLRFPVGGYGKR